MQVASRNSLSPSAILSRIKAFCSLNSDLSIKAPEISEVSPASSLYLAHHLANDYLNVLVVDINTLHAVGALNLLNQIVLHRLFAAHGQNVVGLIDPSVIRFADLYHIALFNGYARTVGDNIRAFVYIVTLCLVTITVRFFLISLKPDNPVYFGNIGKMLGLARLKRSSTGKTLCDILA